MHDAAKAKAKLANAGSGVTAGSMRRKAIQMAKDMSLSEFADGLVPSKRVKV